MAVTTYLSCPFVPVGEISDSTWELRLNEDSLSCAEVSMVSVYGSDSPAVADFHEGVVEITFRSPYDSGRWDDWYFRADFYDGPRGVTDSTYEAEIVQDWPIQNIGGFDILPAGSVFTASIKISRLQENGFVGPLPETATQLYRFAIVTPGFYIGWEVLNVQFLRESPSVNIF